MNIRIAILQFPGSNSEHEAILAVKRAGMQPEEFLWNGSHEKLREYAGYIIVDDFLSEDSSRSSVIAALDPIMQVIKEQSHLGKPILGIGNGAQILVEAGLVPGIEDDKCGMALTDNKRIQDGKVLGVGFYNAWVNIRLSDYYQLNAFTQHLKPNDILNIPIAHAEGRFVIPPALLMEMQLLGANVFQYCDAQGNVVDEFPVNPNGSIDNIAAVSNKAGNVMAMIPHPERTPHGDPIFRSMRDYIQRGYVQRVAPLNYYPRLREMTRYKKPAGHHELIIESMMTDHHESSIKNVLEQLHLPAKIKRYVHWEVECESEETLEKVIENITENIKTSGVIFDNHLTQQKMATFLVRPKDDVLGYQKQQLLEDHFNIKGIRAIRHGILWKIVADQAVINSIIDSHILFNPYAHDCYYY